MRLLTTLGAYPLIALSWLSGMAAATQCQDAIVVDVPAGYSEVRITSISDDGRSAAGYAATSTSVRRAVRWTEAAGTQLLDIGSATMSSAAAISGDGQTIVGTVGPFSSSVPVRWVGAQSAEVLADASGTPGAGDASDVSQDGSVIVGHLRAGGTLRPFVWTAGTGLQDVAPATVLSGRLRSVSSDGQAASGEWQTSSGAYAIRWTSAGGAQELPDWGTPWAFGDHISGDGSVVVGRAREAIFPFRTLPVRWDLGQAPVSLEVPFRTESPRGVTWNGSLVYGYKTSLPYRGPALHGDPIGTTLVAPDYPTVVPVAVNDAGNAFAVSQQSFSLTISLIVRRSPLGISYCHEAVPNASGCTGRLMVTGSDVLAANALRLEAQRLPAQTFGFFLVSPQTALTYQPPGSFGILCLGGPIGRFVGPGQVASTGTAGTLALDVDLFALPSPTGPIQASVGETYMFQAWHRDTAITVGSNFTDAVAVTLH